MFLIGRKKRKEGKMEGRMEGGEGREEKGKGGRRERNKGKIDECMEG